MLGGSSSIPLTELPLGPIPRHFGSLFLEKSERTKCRVRSRDMAQVGRDGPQHLEQGQSRESKRWETENIILVGW